MARSFGTAEFLYLLQAIPWTLLLSYYQCFSESYLIVRDAMGSS